MRGSGRLAAFALMWERLEAVARVDQWSADRMTELSMKYTRTNFVYGLHYIHADERCHWDNSDTTTFFFFSVLELSKEEIPPKEVPEVALPPVTP